MKKFKQTINTDYIYQNDLDRACFQPDIACGKYKDLNKRTQSDKLSTDKAYGIASNPKHNKYQRGLIWMVYKFFDKDSTMGSGIKSITCR